VALALALLVVGLGFDVDGPVMATIAVLGALLLLRSDLRLVVAPVYGAGLVVLLELAQTCHELRQAAFMTRGVVRRRLTAMLATAGVGACAAGVAALAVTGAPGGAAIVTAAGTFAVIALFAGVVRLARPPRVARPDGGLSSRPTGNGEAGRADRTPH